MTSSTLLVEALNPRSSLFESAFDGGRGIVGNAERRLWPPATDSNRTYSISKSGHRGNKRVRDDENERNMKRRPVSQVVMVCVLAMIASEWSCNVERSHAIEVESRTEKEANLRGQVQGGLFNRWTFDQQKSDEAPVGFSTLEFGEGPAADWMVKADPDAPSASHVLAAQSSCPTATCYRLIVADGFQYEYPDVSVRMRFPIDATATGGVVFGVQDARDFYAVMVDLATKTLEVSRVVKGKEASLGQSSLTPKAGPWHTLRIQRNTILSKDFIETFFDGVLAVTVEDQSLTIGQVGLAIRGSTTLDFDSMHAIPLFSHRPLSAPAAY
jgi:hypothetical protein